MNAFVRLLARAASRPAHSPLARPPSAPSAGFSILLPGFSLLWLLLSPSARATPIDDKYAALGGAGGFLGSPLIDEAIAPDRIGRFRHFAGGSIYWSPDTGAWEVHGAIYAKWASLDWEKGVLGYPITDETATPDNVGRYNHFQYGSIYWTPATGAWEVHGAILVKWAEMGWERSCLGYPVSDETAAADGVGRFSRFQNGRIDWTPAGGARPTCGEKRTVTLSAGEAFALPGEIAAVPFRIAPLLLAGDTVRAAVVFDPALEPIAGGARFHPSLTNTSVDPAERGPGRVALSFTVRRSVEESPDSPLFELDFRVPADASPEKIHSVEVEGTVTDAAGAASPLAGRAGAVTAIPLAYRLSLGDVNGDGRRDTRDAILMLRIAVGLDRSDAERRSRADANLDGQVNLLDATILLRAAVGLSPIRAPIAASNPNAGEAAGVVLPVFAYHLERYLRGVRDRTDTDAAIAAVLDSSPEGRAAAERIVERFRAIPLEEKLRVFDPEVVRLIPTIDSRLDTAIARRKMATFTTGRAVNLAVDPPAAPDLLTATVVAVPPDPDTPSTARYGIELKWRDNSSGEDGFRVYRRTLPALPGSAPVLIGTAPAGATGYFDNLGPPSLASQQHCYQVSAYVNSPIHLVGKPPETLASDPTPFACIDYSKTPIDWTDTDHDGDPDKWDACDAVPRGVHGTDGCPDSDEDGWPDFVDGDSGVTADYCPMEWGDSVTDGLLPQPGCPMKFHLHWMGMTILNNSYANVEQTICHGSWPNQSCAPYPLDVGEGTDPFQSGDVSYWKGSGPYAYGVPSEEPYLTFHFINGMSAKGAKETGATTWGCGEHATDRAGENWEPDGDPTGEIACDSTPLESVPGGNNRGMVVFPAFPASYVPIDREFGLLLSIGLWERDWEKNITITQSKDAFAGMVGAVSSTAGAVATCVGSVGIGCLFGVASAVKAIIDWLSPPEVTTVTVKDPDDFMGGDVWAITRQDAIGRTTANGAYGFWIDLPMRLAYACWCQPIGTTCCNTPVQMRARLYFSLHRQGVPEDQVRSLSQPFELVLPWPMFPSK